MEAEVSSLEELIQRATNPQNTAVSSAAVGAFVEAVRHSVERGGETVGDISVEGSPATSIAHAAAKLIAAKVQSPVEWEALQALNVLEACMGGCGPIFRAEVGKFRFLNELIKLVSPKYLGGRTPPDVQARVLALLRHWASVEGQNPPLPKVREAYAMLRKQGVVKDGDSFPPSAAVSTTGAAHPSTALNQSHQPSPMPATNVANPLPGQPQRPKAAAFEDEHLSKLLQRLLQSKHPRDIQDANRLIQAMVRQEEMKAERRSRRATELESARTSARLLWEMLESWSRDGGGVGRAEDEKELMAELHASCGRIAQILPRLASEAPDEATMAEVLQASDELNKTMDKYTAVMVRGELTGPTPGGASLLDLSTPSEEQLPQALLAKDLANLGIDTESGAASSGSREKELQAVLGDLFGGTSDSLPSSSVVKSPAPLLVPHAPSATDMPVKASGSEVLESGGATKAGGLNDLDALGESLLKQSLPPSVKPSGPMFHKAPEKIPMNLLGKASSAEACKNPKDSVFPLIGSSGIFADTSLSPTKESCKSSDIELLSDLMTPVQATNTKANTETNSLDYLIGLSLSGASKTAQVISSGKSLIPQAESVSSTMSTASINALSGALNKNPLASSFSSMSNVPSAVLPNTSSSVSATVGTFPSHASPAHTISSSGVKRTDSTPSGQDGISSGMNLDSLEGLVESVLMAGSGTTGSSKPSDSGVSLLENALKSLRHPKDAVEIQPNTTFSDKSKRASVDEEGPNGSGDDAMVGWSDGEAEVSEKKMAPEQVAPETKAEEVTKVPVAVKPIGDINIPLQRIRPGKRPPIVALAAEEGSGLSVELRLGNAESGLDGREDISVLVITITSRLEMPISNCLFQAVVPKGCRLRLLPPSGTDLPAHNPFLPPAAITQVMLIASAHKEPICLKWVLSYVTEDEETATEMGEVERLPLS